MDEPKFTTGQERLGFVRKLYGILASQICFTAVMTIIPCVSYDARLAVLSYPSLAFLAIFVALGSMCALFCCDLDRKVPTNYTLLGVFTVAEAYTVMFVCATVKNPLIVLQAALLTAGIVIGLTVYAVTSKRDFTTCGAFLFMFSFAMLAFSMICMIIGFQLPTLYCVFGVVLFGLYLIFDTQLILGGKAHSFDEDQYILAAICLYMDIINIFLYLLQILNSEN